MCNNPISKEARVALDNMFLAGQAVEYSDIFNAKPINSKHAMAC